jgi:hypothetical protein
MYPCGILERSDILVLFTLTRLQFLYLAKSFIAPAIHLFINRYSKVAALHSLITYLYSFPWSRYIQMPVKRSHILAFCFFTTLCLLVLIALRFFNTSCVTLIDFQVGRINPGTLGAVLTFHCSGYSRLSIQLSCFPSDSMSAVLLFSLSVGLSKSLFQLTRSSVSQRC